MTKFFSSVVGLCLAAGNLLAADAEITVDFAKSLGPVNHKIFGQNMEAWDSRGVFRKEDIPLDSNQGVRDGQGTFDPVGKTFYPEVLQQFKRVAPGSLRYPGGCLAHTFDWRKVIGPVEQRPEGYTYGLDDFLRYCEILGAEPIITCTDYGVPPEELPQHCADLVEYLNAPATPEHPWAMKRKEYGREKPWGVKYFEIGNETDHGTHKRHGAKIFRVFSADEFATLYNATAKAMKKVDPTVQTSPGTTPTNGELYANDWFMTIYDKMMDQTDFLAVHLYGPRMPALKNVQDAFLAGMAQAEQLEDYIAKMHALMKKRSGKEVPLFVTEFNISCTGGDKPAYRVRYVSALEMADLYRMFSDPANNIGGTYYWQLVNGWFGAFGTDKGKIKFRRPLTVFLEGWAKSRGDELVFNKVTRTPRQEIDFTGAKIRTARGDRYEPVRTLASIALPKADGKRFPADKGVTLLESTPDSLKVRFADADKACYSEYLHFKRPADAAGVRLTFEARYLPAAGDSGEGAFGLGLCDDRGYEKTKSAVAVQSSSLRSSWQTLSEDFNMLFDATGGRLLLRSEPAGKRNGVLEIRNIRLQGITQESVPAYALVTSYAAKSKDGRTLHLVVFNKSLDRNLSIDAALRNCRAVAVTGEEYFDADLNARFAFKPAPLACKLEGDILKATLKPHSMNCFAITLK